MKTGLTFLLPLLCLLGCTSRSNTDGADVWTEEVEAFGALRAMHHEGKTGPAVSLSAVLPDSQLYAVGALAELSGEVTVVGGLAYLSRPRGDSVNTDVFREGEAGAALLVTSRVPAWRTVTNPADIPFERLDEEIAALAASAGIPPGSRFPFMVEGDMREIHWHVIDGARLPEGETSHQDHLEAAVTFERDRLGATLLGFYSENDEGVFTHMGSRTHVHCVVQEPFSAGHVDHVVIPAGATVRFPETP